MFRRQATITATDHNTDNDGVLGRLVAELHELRDTLGAELSRSDSENYDKRKARDAKAKAVEQARRKVKAGWAQVEGLKDSAKEPAQRVIDRMGLRNQSEVDAHFSQVNKWLTAAERDLATAEREADAMERELRDIEVTLIDTDELRERIEKLDQLLFMFDGISR